MYILSKNHTVRCFLSDVKYSRCLLGVWPYRLAPAPSAGDVGDLVVLDAAPRGVPPGVQGGGGLVEHNQIGGRFGGYCRHKPDAHTHAHTHTHTYTKLGLC